MIGDVHVSLGLVLAGALAGMACGVTASPGKARVLDFETASAQTWTEFIPEESKGDGCLVVHDMTVARSGNGSARLHSEKESRFGIRFRGAAFPVSAGERYRLTAWVRVDFSFVTTQGTPGVVGRFTLYDKSGSDLSGGHRYVDVAGDVREAAESMTSLPLPPDEWVYVSGELVVPDDCAALLPMIFVWKGSGTVWVDDVRLERVDVP